MSETERKVFQFFNEIGIINQLATDIFQSNMPDGLHVSHFSVLNHLVRLGDGVTPLKITNAFQVSKGTMTNTLSVLSKRGLIRITPHESDGRSKVVCLTDEGRAFQKQAIESLFPAIQQLGEKMDWARVVETIPELERVRKILDENRD
ncbi:MAG: MarR family transcriptional regulator [Lentilitoribacter sp.]